MDQCLEIPLHLKRASIDPQLWLNKAQIATPGVERSKWMEAVPDERFEESTQLQQITEETEDRTEESAANICADLFSPDLSLSEVKMSLSTTIKMFVNSKSCSLLGSASPRDI